MNDDLERQPVDLPIQEDSFLDPANLEEARHEYVRFFEACLRDDLLDDLSEKARELSPGDLSEIVRPLSVEDTARVIQLLPAQQASDVLAEINNRSFNALMQLLDIEAIADLVEDMPSDEATDLLGELEAEKAQEILDAMDEEERGEVAELLQYSPDTAGGLMAKEFVAVVESASCRQAVEVVRSVEEEDKDELEQLHFIFVVDDEERLVGRIPLVKMLLEPWGTPVSEIMERDPLFVAVDLDQEMVAQFVMDHDLVTLPVVDADRKLLGVISADDVLDVIEEEASEDFSRLAGTSAEEFGETSSLKVARARLPWLLAALVGQIGCVFMMQHFEAAIATTVALTFFIPAIMAMGGNTGIQTSSVVVRGLATGEVDVYHIRRYLLRELGTALVTGGLVSGSLFVIAGVVFGDQRLALVLMTSMMSVIVFAALVGTAIPLLLHRFGIDPAIATGPFITTTNDFTAILIYLGMASLMLS